MTEGKIEVVINEKGEIKVKTNGIFGPSCVDEVGKLLEDIASITEVNKTDEFYMKETQSNVQKSREEVRK